MSASKILIIVALILFILEAFAVHPNALSDVALLPLGLAFLAGGFLA